MGSKISCSWVLIFAAISFISLSSALAESRVEWFISYTALNGGSLLISNEARTFPLKGDWQCTVSSVSPGGWYEARQTVCRKGDEQIEFSVQCERQHPEHRTQIRFRDASTNKMQDYIEVACRTQQ
jgi:hypothetical protein